MKIGIVATVAGPGPIAGGVWRVAQTHASALTRAGHEVHILAGWLGERPQPDEQPAQTTLLPLRKPLPGNDIRFLLASGLRKNVTELTEWAETLHIHLCRDHVSTTALRIAQQAAHPRVMVQAHGMLDAPGSSVTRMFDRLVARGVYDAAHRWLSLGIAEDTQLRRLGVPEDRIVRVHNAVATPQQTWSGAPRTPHFVFASRLHPRKQPQIFVEAALAYLRSGHQGTFTIAGPDQGEADPIRSRLAASGLADHFAMLGAVSNSQVTQELLRATAMVLPSLEEPYPMIVLEAAALGVPVIVSDQTGVSEILASRAAGVVIEPTAQNLAEAMTQLAKQPDRLEHLSAAGRSVHQELWTESSIAQALERIYRATPRSIDLTAARTAHRADPARKSTP